jgi:hypothetical protein
MSSQQLQQGRHMILSLFQMAFQYAFSMCIILLSRTCLNEKKFSLDIVACRYHAIKYLSVKLSTTECDVPLKKGRREGGET